MVTSEVKAAGRERVTIIKTDVNGVKTRRRVSRLSALKQAQRLLDGECLVLIEASGHLSRWVGTPWGVYP